MSDTATAHAAHATAHHELGFLRTYVFSTDHKMIGLQYGITAFFFLLSRAGFFVYNTPALFS